MRINDTSNKHISLYHDFLFWTKAEEDADTLADFIRNANFALDNVVRKIFQSDGRSQYDDRNNTTHPIATVDLVAGQEHYTTADSHLRIARLRAKNRQGNWVTLENVDRSELSDDQLNDTGVPQHYDKLGVGLFISPVPDYASTGGLEITFQRGSNYFTTADTTKEPGFDSIYHRYVSLLPASDYCATNDMPNQYTAVQRELTKLDEEVQQYYAMRDRDGTHKIKVKQSKVRLY